MLAVCRHQDKLYRLSPFPSPDLNSIYFLNLKKRVNNKWTSFKKFQAKVFNENFSFIERLPVLQFTFPIHPPIDTGFGYPSRDTMFQV